MSKKDPKAIIMEYLEMQNRPYYAITVFNNLHQEFSQITVVKCLETLAKEGKIVEILYKDQKLYGIHNDIVHGFIKRVKEINPLVVCELNSQHSAEETKERMKKLESYKKMEEKETKIRKNSVIILFIVIVFTIFMNLIDR